MYNISPIDSFVLEWRLDWVWNTVTLIISTIPTRIRLHYYLEPSNGSHLAIYNRKTSSSSSFSLINLDGLKHTIIIKIRSLTFHFQHRAIHKMTSKNISPISLELITILISNTWVDFSSYYLPLRSKANTWKLCTYSIIFNRSTSYFTLILRRIFSYNYQTIHK